MTFRLTAPFAFPQVALISSSMKALAAALALSVAAALPLAAQDTATVEEAAAPDTAEVALTPLERWMADPTTVFEGHEIDLAALQWRVRPLVVFADSEFDPAFQRQMDLLMADLPSLVERDVMIIRDTDPANPSALRLQLRPRGFMLALIGKDGGVKLRKPLPWDVREISRSIDKWPIRLQEIEAQRGIRG